MIDVSNEALFIKEYIFKSKNQISPRRFTEKTWNQIRIDTKSLFKQWSQNIIACSDGISEKICFWIRLDLVLNYFRLKK